MTLNLTTLLFLLIPTSVLTLVHWYFYRRLVKPMAFPKWLRVSLGFFLLSALVAMPAGMILGRFFPMSWRSIISYPIYLWMGVMTILLTLLLTVDLFYLGRFVFRKMKPLASEENPARRLFVTRAVGASVAALTLAATGVSVAGAMRVPGVRRVRVILPNLPAGLDGMTIAQFTDLHVCENITRPYVETVAERINQLKADLVVFTGDLVDGSVEKLGGDVAPLAHLKSKWGTYFVTGNHDYYSGVVPWIAEVERLGMRVLRNERVTLGVGHDLIDLAGVDDSGTGRGMYPKGHGADVAKALKNPTPGRPVILLAHQPKEAGKAAKYGASLMLSGHTHGGQIWPFRHLVGLAQPYVDGLHLHQNKTWIYVSRGTGFWGPPMRLGAPSEITRIELRRTGTPEVTWV